MTKIMRFFRKLFGCQTYMDLIAEGKMTRSEAAEIFLSNLPLIRAMYSQDIKMKRYLDMIEAEAKAMVAGTSDGKN
jgi:hypothetical protein